MPRKERIICDGIPWIDVVSPSAGEMQELSEIYQLHKEIVRDCLEPDHLPKYDVVDDVHFLILRFYVPGPEKRIATIQALTNKIAIFYTDKFLITIHLEELDFIDSIQRKYISTKKCTTTVEIVTKLLWNALETFEEPAQRLSDEIDFYENNIVLRKIEQKQLEALYYIKRQASIAHKILTLMAEPINNIHTIPRDNPALQDVRDQHLKMQTLNHQVLEDVNNLVNLYISFSAQKTSDVMKVLTVFSVFFMPLTFIVGIYGMNFDHMPELNKRWGYPSVLILMLVVTISIYLWFRRKKWL